MEEVPMTVDQIPVRSESTDFELQAHAVAKEAAEIREALVESIEDEISVPVGDELTSEKGLDVDVATIPVLVEFKPLSGGPAPVGDQIQIEVPVESSAERNNKENEKNANTYIGEDTKTEIVDVAADQTQQKTAMADVKTPASAASEGDMDQSSNIIVTGDVKTPTSEDKQLISDEPEKEKTVDVPLTEEVVSENILTVEDSRISVSESSTEIVGCCVFITAPTHATDCNKNELSISPKPSLTDFVDTKESVAGVISEIAEENAISNLADFVDTKESVAGVISEIAEDNAISSLTDFVDTKESVAGVISEIAEKNAIYDPNRRTRGGRGSNSQNSGPASRPGTGIFSNNYSAPTSESQPNTNGYRGVGRGSIRGSIRIRGSSRGNTAASGGERSRNNNAVIREPRAPEEGRGFAPRGTGTRGNPVGRTGTIQPKWRN